MKYNLSKVVFTGDSLVDENIVAHATDVTWDTSSHWVYMLSRIFDFDYVNTAVCGDTIKNINQNMQSRIFQYNPTFVFLDGGVNDTNVPTEPDLIVDYMRSIIKAVLSKGIQCGLIWFPTNHADISTETRTRLVSLASKYVTLANELRATYPDSFTFFNMEGAADFGTTTLDPSTIVQTYRRDILHFTQGGYLKIAEFISNQMRKEDSTLNQTGGVTCASPSSIGLI